MVAVSRTTETRQPWQIEQAALCPCHGTDDMCPCQNVDRTRPAWMDCASRGPWTANSIKHRLSEATQQEGRCRRAYREPYMSEPANWLADCYAEVAEVWRRRLSALTPRSQDQ